MADDTVKMVVVVAMVITLAVVMLLELRFLRSKKAKRLGELDLPDRAHNAILTTKAIAETLGRGGVRSPEATEIVREAEAAYRERNYRVVLELTDRAKEVLRDAKRRQQEEGDLAKLDRIQPKGAAEEVTTEERLTKELPPNLVPSRFTMTLARDEIAAAKTRGRDTGEAERLVAEAQALYDKQEYDAALRQSVRARRALEEAPEAPEAAASVPPAAPAGTRACASCGAPLAADDTFCRKCGVKVQGPRTCASCGAEIPASDAFCRKCGARATT